MYSALKHKGQPLYKLARQGIEVEREARCVSIFSNELVCFADGELELEIHCSKGTYIRTIAEELGALLGVGAHVTALHRRAAGPFEESDMVSMALLRVWPWSVGDRARRAAPRDESRARSHGESPGPEGTLAARRSCDNVRSPAGAWLGTVWLPSGERPGGRRRNAKRPGRDCSHPGRSAGT